MKGSLIPAPMAVMICWASQLNSPQHSRPEPNVALCMPACRARRFAPEHPVGASHVALSSPEYGAPQNP